MKIIAFIINIFLPGVGTLLVGKIKIGIVQILLALLATALIGTHIGVIIGIPLGVANWIWALVSVATARMEPEVIEVGKDRNY